VKVQCKYIMRVEQTRGDVGAIRFR